MEVDEDDRDIERVQNCGGIEANPIGGPRVRPGVTHHRAFGLNGLGH